jgi:hypothetical protein
MRHTHVLSFLNFTRDKVGGLNVCTSKIVMPEALNDSISSFFEESGRAVAGRTRAKVGCPSRTLAAVMNGPRYPVAPTTKILLIPIYSVLFALMGRIKTKIKKALTCINQHRDFPTPYANQFYKLDIPSFQFQAMSITKYQIHTKQAPSNNRQ